MKKHRFAAPARWLVSFAVAALATFALVAARADASWWGDEEQPPTPPPALRPQIEVAFVLDTTGSMSGLIDGAKRKVWAIANHLAGAGTGLRVALVAYRDRGDDYVTQRLDLTEDVDALYARLLQLEAGGGGDTPESVNQALHEAVTKLDWSAGSRAYRVIFLVGDAPPHTDYGDVPYAESVRAARQRGIAVNAIQCGDLQETTPFWREIARIGAGEYAAIAQDGGMITVATPMDDELARLNRDLAGTVVGYGSAEQQRELRGKVARALEAPAAAAADRLSYLSKQEEKNVVSGESDLVDAAKQGLDPSAVPEAALPPELQRMEPEERRAYVARKSEERAQLQSRIDALAKERDAWLREQARKDGAQPDAFDRKVLSAIEAQAAAQGIRWK